VGVKKFYAPPSLPSPARGEGVRVVVGPAGGKPDYGHYSLNIFRAVKFVYCLLAVQDWCQSGSSWVLKRFIQGGFAASAA
jgi:hypothetical protein